MPMYRNNRATVSKTRLTDFFFLLILLQLDTFTFRRQALTTYFKRTNLRPVLMQSIDDMVLTGAEQVV